MLYIFKKRQVTVVNMCVVMPFGLTNTLATYQQLMERRVSSLSHSVWGRMIQDPA